MKKLLLVLLMIPFISMSQSQIGEDILGMEEDILGAAVSLSANGEVVAIGAPSSNQGPGVTRIFENTGDVWTQVGEDIVGEVDTDRSGNQVALSADGTVVATSSPFNDGNGSNAGHVRVFENIGGTWVQIGEEIDGESANDLSGGAISISADGSIIAIGAVSNDDGASSAGHVRVFENQGGTWVQVGQDVDGNGQSISENFGGSVSLSSDGTVFAAGATSNDNVGENAGAVRVYENQNGTWTQIGDDINGVLEADMFGEVVSLSGDGTIVAVSAPFVDAPTTDTGQVRVFENQNGSWIQRGQDINGVSSLGRLGTGLSLSASGNVLVASSPFVGNNAGLTLIFQFQDGQWVQVGDAINGEQSGDLSGFALSIARDTNIFANGELFNDDNGSSAGQVRIFNIDDAILSTESFDTANLKLIVNNEQEFVEVSFNTAKQFLEQTNVYAITGQRLFSSEEAKFSTAGLKTGVYIVEIETSSGKISKKVLITKSTR